MRLNLKRLCSLWKNTIPSWSVPSRIEKARCGDLPYRAITVAHVPVQYRLHVCGRLLHRGVSTDAYGTPLKLNEITAPKIATKTRSH